MSNNMHEFQIRRWFGVFVCIGWIHLVFAVYPMPFQRHSEIVVQAEQAVEAERSLLAQGISKESLSEGTKEDWIEGLTLNLWISWVANIAYLLAGLAGGVMAYQGRKNWQWIVGLASSIFLISTCYPWVKTEHLADTISFLFARVFKDGINFSSLRLAYILFVQPIYHFCILAGAVILWRQQTSKLRAA